MGRIALVTGGAGGIGAAAARRLAESGLTLAVADLDPSSTRKVVKTLPGNGHFGATLNVSDEASVRACFETVEQTLGPIAVLVHTAGILGQDLERPRPAIQDLQLEQWERVFAINARGCFLCLREMARRRIAAPVPHARIVTIASAAAQLGGYQANSAYIASKGAVLSLTKGAARDLAPFGVTVNCVSPGPIDTPMLQAARGRAQGDAGFQRLAMVPAGRIGRPEEVAAAIAYLTSEDAGFVTGATLDINGGLHMQ